MEFWAQQILNGIMLSALLILLTSGLTIIFGILLIVNFAHGSLYMWGAYVGLLVVAATGNFWLALLVAPLAVGAVGIGLERVLLQPMRSKPVILSLLLTFGLTLVLDDTARLLFGPVQYSLKSPAILSGSVNLFGLIYPSYRLFIIGFGFAVIIALYLFLERTLYGTVIRAASVDREIVEIMGVNTKTIFMAVFGLGCALAALGGVIVAPLLTIYPTMGHSIIIDSFVVLVLGGLGSLRGTAIAALLVGQVQSLGAVLMPEFSMVLVFGLMAVVLLVRPRGILNLGRIDDGH